MCDLIDPDMSTARITAFAGVGGLRRRILSSMPTGTMQPLDPDESIASFTSVAAVLEC